jgi:hypothetical protein
LNVELIVRRLGLLLLLLLLAGSVAGDDRRLLGAGVGESSLFVLLDAGEAMALGFDDRSLATGADDPGSRLWSAKAALAAMLESNGDLDYGIATFPDQNGLHVVSTGVLGLGVELGSSSPDDACSGWEPNGDDAADEYRGHSLKWPTETGQSPPLSVGDVVPPTSGATGSELLLGRLAPNRNLGESTSDFGIARYFGRQPSDGQHRLLDQRARPLAPWGRSSIAAALGSFEEWLEEWSADERLPGRSCGRLELVVVTGSPESCADQAVPVASRLFSTHGVRVHIVGLGLSDPRLDAVAAAGGSGVAKRTTTREALEEALVGLAGEISAPTGLSGSPLGTGVTSGQRLVVQTSLLAIEGSSLWSGRVDGYLRPVPSKGADGGGGPDRERACDQTQVRACRAWDAGEAMLLQAPTAAEAARGELRLGVEADERRVYYGARDGSRRLLLPPRERGEQEHLYGPGGMGLDPGDPDFASRGEQVIEQTLAISEGAGGPFVLGDSFHSQPLLIEPPNRLDYLVADSQGRLEPCGPRFDGETEDHVPYGCFARHLSRRRRMLALGANDGQLHLFDAGVPEAGSSLRSTAGSGHELAAFVPRSVLGPLRLAAVEGGHRYSVDGTVTVDDFLSRAKEGGVGEWRTALVGGLREGGAGYYALDVTQPDRLDPHGGPVGTSYVPSCAEGGPECGMPSAFPGLPALDGRPFPSLLWEFSDLSDEDGNGAPDLGYTWSRAATGRIRSSEGDRFVVIFGGGMDPEIMRAPLGSDGEPHPWSGNFLYMLDLEDGSILYKRALDRPRGLVEPASVPGGPTAVDLDADGYLDTIYVGTTGGFLFKVDVGSVGQLDSDSGRIESAAWSPAPLFDTLGEPIFHAPKVVFVAARGLPAVAFGTGDREDLWAETGMSGGFYTFLDEGTTPFGDPLTPASLEPLEARGREVERGRSLLAEPLTDAQRAAGRVPGWSMRLAVEERLLSPPLVAAGVLIFNTFVPLRPGVGPECGGGGVSRSYAVATSNGNALSEGPRFEEVAGLVATPMVDVALSEPAAVGSGSPPSDGDGTLACSGEEAERLRERLTAELHGQACVPARRSLDVVALDPAGGSACRVSLPVCVTRHHWRER